MKKAVFLDRDGVINEDLGYVYEWSNFKIYDDFLPFLKSLIKLEFIPIIVTNQSGIYRGYYTEKQFHKLMTQFNNYLSKYNFDPISYYYCSHTPDPPIECECRKPLPGLVLQAVKDYQFEVSESIMIGDKMSDIDCAMAARIKNTFLLSRDRNIVKEIKSGSYSEISSLNQIKLQ